MEHVFELIDEMVTTLSDTVKSEVVCGKTVDLGQAKVVPLSRVSIGFGGGGGEGDQKIGSHKERKGKHSGGKGTGGGAGGGAKVRPVGVLVFTKDGVKVESIPDRAGIIDKVFGKIPDLIDLAKKHNHR